MPKAKAGAGPPPMERALYLSTMNRINKHISAGMIKINSVFQSLDDSGDGRVDRGEFQKGLGIILAKASFQLSKKEMAQVFSTIDNDGSGHMIRQLQDRREDRPAGRPTRTQPGRDNRTERGHLYLSLQHPEGWIPEQAGRDLHHVVRLVAKV